MIKNRLYNSILTLLLFPFVVQAQADTDRNAYSIVQDATTEIICESTSSALRKESYTITILNENGIQHTFFVYATSSPLSGNSPEK
jgi:hypothetical protein